MKRNTKGFTLIELLIVVVIIGILAAIAIPKFAATKERAYVASMKTDLRNIVTAEEGYAGNNGGAYLAPSDSTKIATLGAQLSTGNSMSAGTAVAAAGAQAPGWNATIQSTNTGKKCYIFVGGATNPAPAAVQVGMKDGAPACDQ